jgi:hypothetical protein
MTQVDEPSTILSINYNNKADGFSKNEWSSNQKAELVTIWTRERMEITNITKGVVN